MMAKEVELEYEVELARQRLVQECPDFNTIDAFRVLDL
jgi:hypothetical protein